MRKILLLLLCVTVTLLAYANPITPEAVVYDLQGRKVLNPRQGVFIVNGRLVIK